MTLLITLFAAIICTVIWYKGYNKDLRIGTLCWIYWGASLMWFIDACFEYAEFHAEFFTPAPVDMLNDAYLGLSVVAHDCRKAGCKSHDNTAPSQKNPCEIKIFYKKLKKPVTSLLRTRLRSEGINYYPSVNLDKHRGYRSYPATVITSVNARARRRVRQNSPVRATASIDGHKVTSESIRSKAALASRAP